MAKRLAPAKAKAKRAKKNAAKKLIGRPAGRTSTTIVPEAAHREWMRDLLTPRTTRSKGPVLRLEFSTPSDGIPPEEFGRLFANLWRIEEELANAEPSASGGPRAGLYVTFVSYNSPLQVDISLISLPEGAVDAIVKFFTDLLFYRQTKKLKDAEAAERAERVRAMKLDNAMKAVQLAHNLEHLSDESMESVRELMDVTGDMLDSSIQLEQAHVRSLALPEAPPNSGRRSTAAKRKK